jgi:uncharacterized protein (DUF2141 family)
VRRAALAAAALVISVAPSLFAGSGAITARVVNLRSSAGHVGCTLYASAKGFPTDPKSAAQERWCGIANGEARCAFAPVPEGVYAIACFHDENDNKKLDTNVLGIPTEGVGCSNGARGRFGPPSFDDAKFKFDGAARDVRIPIAY